MVSKQRLLQLKYREKGVCVKCGRTAEPASRPTKYEHGKSPYCLKHRRYDRIRKLKGKSFVKKIDENGEVFYAKRGG